MADFASLTRRGFLAHSAVGTAAISAGAWPTLAHSSSADLVLLNGDIITQDPQRPRASALAVGHGLILATGSDSDIRALAGRDTLIIDAGGRTVIPGLNDSHQHPTRAGRFYAAELRWDGVRSLERGLNMIREAAAVTPAGQWVRIVGGWSPFQFAERRMPTPAELTAAAPETPVFVLYLYSRGFLNRAAVRARGLTLETKAPAGTRYEFTPDGGAILHAEPNPDLLYQAIGALPVLSEDEQALSTRHYYRELNRFGLTSVIDAGGGGHRFPEDYSGSDALASSGDLSVRVSKYLFPQDKGGELAEFQQWTSHWQAGVNRAECLLHGYEVEGAGEFLVWSAGDYENFLSDRPDIRERPNWDRELLEATRHLLRNRWPLRIHATYDQSTNLILDVFERAHALEIADGRDGFGGIRWAIDHGETLQRPTLQRIKALGGGIAMQARMAYAGEYFLERYGAETTRNAPPMRDVIDAGIPLGLGTDGTRVASYNPWPAIAWAVTGRSVGETELHDPGQRLTREEALFYYTVGSAWFSQEETVKGRLRPGQYADFALLNAPYLDVVDDDLRAIEADLTVLAGKPVYGVGNFAALVDALPLTTPEWSPIRLFGGFAN